jgi:Photosynthetic reaction centre cytochrome C subunit
MLIDRTSPRILWIWADRTARSRLVAGLLMLHQPHDWILIQLASFRRGFNMRTLIVVLLAAGVAAQNRPDMSGVWQLNKARSKVESEMAWLKVGLTSSTFSVYMRTFKEGGKEDEGYDWQFVLGPAENSNTMHGAPMKSHAQWEGDALMVRSVTMFGADALKTVDRYTLSADGNTLTYEEKHQFANEPEGTSVFVFERRAVSAWPAPQLAEEAYKNIQVLKGMPAARLPVVMGFFTRWLGVNCAHCHVAGDFVSDAKPAKQTARKMLNMVTAINRDSFGGSGPVTCWTCHRGSVKPESLPAQPVQ